MAIERINPAGISTPVGYTHVVKATGGTTVYIAGQVAADASGNVVGAGDLAAQTRQVLTNLKTALAAAGGGFGDVVKMTTFIVNYTPEMRAAYRAVRGEFVTGDLPASTLVGVQALAAPDYLIEIEAIAVIGG
ncbi:MAG: RidA family protein [Dehalococcoidia bacterium]|nr:RidA family protein [Dehalococcoidia bacterium]